MAAGEKNKEGKEKRRKITKKTGKKALKIFLGYKLQNFSRGACELIRRGKK